MQDKNEKGKYRIRRQERRRLKRAEKRSERRKKLKHFSSNIKNWIKEKKRKRKEKAKQAQLEHERKKRQEKEAGGFWAVRRRRIRRFFLRTWRSIKKIKTADRRHILALGVVVLSLVATFTVCDLSVERLLMAFEDFKNSIVYYFCEVTNREYTGDVSINTMPEIDLQRVCPFSIADVLRKLELLGDVLFTKQMFMAYIAATLRVCRKITLYIVTLAPVVVLLIFVIRWYVFKHRTDRRDTKPLIFWKKHIRPIFRGVVGWTRDMVAFIKEKGYEFWLILIWLFNLNFVTILVEFFAWYFYFIPSSSFASLGVNLYRLFIDALIMLWSAPWWFWAIMAWIVFDDIRRNIGFTILRVHEKINEAFFEVLCVFVLIVGTMGLGKTTLMTSLALTGQNVLRKRALKLMFRLDLQFPNFPWQRFEDAIDGAHQAGIIKKKVHVKRFMKKKIKKFEENPIPHNLFGYDFKNEAQSFNDCLQIKDLFSALVSYGELYYTYTIDLPLILSNYSIRSDSILCDEGNHPFWDDDFFQRTPEESMENQEYSHIFDWDTMRTGKMMDPNNPLRGSTDIGIKAITEGAKDRGNQVENKGMKKEDVKANPLNDGFNLRIKTDRHAALMEGYCFSKTLMDEQRADSLGADARELGDVINIRCKSEKKIAMPFFALGKLIYALWDDKMYDFYYELRKKRGDQSLIKYFIINLYCLFYHYYLRIVNTFGYHVLTLEVQDGKGEGEIERYMYYIQYKKDYSLRFRSDGFASAYEAEGEACEFGIEDIEQFGSLLSTVRDIKKTHSYFGNLLIERFLSKVSANDEDYDDDENNKEA